MGCFWFFCKFLIFLMKIIQILPFETDFFYPLFTKIVRYVCTQLRIFQKEIKSTLNKELMHIFGERG
jgi:hypothetical protein